MAPEFLNTEIGVLLALAGRPDAHFECVPVATGGNNRVTLVTAGRERFIAKRYFNESSERDRMGVEFSFLEHVWNCGMRCVPRPLAFDSTSSIALYEFIDGRQLRPGEADAEKISQVARFFANLNAESNRAAGAYLRSASDACFSTAEHLRSVDRRIDRLSSFPNETPADRECAAFVSELAAAWVRARKRVLRAAADPEAAIPPHWRCLSPSDFGFHNALLRPSGEVCFLDFEYAGWDDPAKMAGDFFAHPGLPVPPEHFDRFVGEAFAPFRDAALLVERTRGLRAVARVRWCLIILNEFLPDVARRRRFADPDLDLEQRKLRQLGKARQLYRLQTL